MSVSIDNGLTKYNFNSFISLNIIEKLLNNDCDFIGIFTENRTHHIIDKYYTIINRILVDNEAIKIGFSKDYFDINIENKFVYAPCLTSKNILTNNFYQPYLVFDKQIKKIDKYFKESYNEQLKDYDIGYVANNIDDISDIYFLHNNINSIDSYSHYIPYYDRVFFTNEKTISDLYINCFKYEYDWNTMSYNRIEDEKKCFNNLIKYSLSKIVLNRIGSPYDRCSDYSRLFIWLLNKLNLNNNIDNNILEKLNEFCPTDDTINNILNRELILQTKLKEIKDKYWDLYINSELYNR